MRAIRKTAEPASLTTYRCTHLATYITQWQEEDAGKKPKTTRRVLFDGFRDKEILRDHIFEEQRGLCCFCSAKLVNDPLKMSIAHWRPVDVAPDEQLSYSNLLGSCLGSKGHPEHCDRSQKSQTLRRNPANMSDRIEDVIHFLPSGAIESSDPAFNLELGNPRKADGTFAPGVLNLNVEVLRNNRKSVLDSFTKRLNKLKPLNKPLNKSELKKLLIRFRGEGPEMLPQFAPVIAYWLKKRLEREP